MRTTWIWSVVVLLTAVAVAATTAAAWNSSTAADDVIYACRDTHDGLLRAVGVDAHCRKNETALTWNVRGAAGSTGPAGPQGVAGAKGEPGPGLASLEALAGLACTAAGVSGSVAVDYDSARRAVLTCVASGGGGGGEETAEVRINEFAVGMSGSLGDEFVELINAGTASADIGGYRLAYRSAAGTTDVALATIPAGTILAPGAFYLLGGASYAGAARPDQAFTTGLASTAGGLAIRDPSGRVVDSLGYGSATNAFVEGSAAPAPAVTAPPGASAGRIPDGRDTNDNAADFSGSSTPTPRAGNR